MLRTITEKVDFLLKFLSSYTAISGYAVGLYTHRSDIV